MGSGCCHGEDHGDGEGQEAGFHDPFPSLYKYVQVDQVICLNEEIPGSGKRVFKPCESRQDRSMFVYSNDGDELLFSIPMVGSVKIMSIAVSSGCDEEAPKCLKMFVNRDDVDFGNVNSLVPAQELSLNPANEIVYYPLRASKFSNVHSLVLHFSKSLGETKSRLYYIGLHGIFTKLSRDPIISIYEATPNIADHKVKERLPSKTDIC